MRRLIWKHASNGASAGFVYVVLALIAASCLHAQEKPAVEADKSSVAAQPVKRDYRFEVASIRPGPSSTPGPQGPPYTPGHFRLESTTIPGLAFRAFEKTQGYELQNPQWMNSVHFTVSANLPEGTSKADLPIMIQHLLEDRFAMKYHHEARQVSGYELVRSRPDARLAKSGTPEVDGATLDGSGFKIRDDGMPEFSKDAGSSDGCARGGCWLHGHNRTMQVLAADLARHLEAPVMDATGLEGGYDYTLLFSVVPYSGPGILSPMPPPGGAGPGEGGGGAQTPPEHPLLRDALKEELGLELRPMKNVPIDVVVIDDAKREPTEN